MNNQFWQTTLSVLFNFSVFDLIKPVLLVFLVFYLAFSFVVWRQVALMNSAVVTNWGGVLKLVAVVQIILTVILLIAIAGLA